jgi:hypothetical protein
MPPLIAVRMNFYWAQFQQEVCHASRIKNANVEAPGGQAAGDLFSIPIKFIDFFAELGIEGQPGTKSNSWNQAPISGLAFARSKNYLEKEFSKEACYDHSADHDRRDSRARDLVRSGSCGLG